MLVLALKPGHDGSVAVVQNRKLLYSLESEKDSVGRYSALTPMNVLDAVERLERPPDVIALGGWREQGAMRDRSIGAGYAGVDAITTRSMRLFGQQARYFSSSHERSHIMMALGMAPREDHALQTVLVWEGDTGAFYLVNRKFEVVRKLPVLSEPGGRYAFLFALADPTFPDSSALPRLGDAGKLMALAAYGTGAGANATAKVTPTVDRILALDSVYPAPKGCFRDCSLYNAGVESEPTKVAAGLLGTRIFDLFASAAIAHMPSGTPLRVSGGCGLNCDWNMRWGDLGHFTDVFVPPCPNDSGSAIGTAIDALATFTGDPHINWGVYSGLDFDMNVHPDPARWTNTPLDYHALASAIGRGRVVAWVQGRWEIGPRALGNRSILAAPFDTATRDRLNMIKQRESYRPIAPCCRDEDLAEILVEDFENPYMLYFRHLRSGRLRAVTHVDGSARVQTVSHRSNAKLHGLLSAFAGQYGVGALCNTSLNFNGHGFINRLSDLVRFCEERGIEDMVVGDDWYQTIGA